MMESDLESAGTSESAVVKEVNKSILGNTLGENAPNVTEESFNHLLNLQRLKNIKETLFTSLL